uniref:AlNc14C134G7044 protein n=1 Tax=Albugo laibachii Nc14 TaxID=890382 RepID=F0WKJ2_9STRA|nr:AlNc14C134G7044 [Albugo laibachii Nc14]|eukprot:CCA21798.1 AlNc14C134G7044 [Albugo laibachii Nc14]
MRDLQPTFGVQIYANATAWWNADMSVSFPEYQFSDRGHLWRVVALHVLEKIIALELSWKAASLPRLAKQATTPALSQRLVSPMLLSRSICVWIAQEVAHNLC